MDYQVQAVRSVVDLFNGQGMNRGDLISTDTALFTVQNSLSLPDAHILENLGTIQQDNKLIQDDELLKEPFGFPNFTVEMETGTGKTYVYIRTALELYRTYGWRKFIIIVPSIAIKEGVTKTFEVTREHFANLFGNIPYKWYAYDSKRLSDVRNFAYSNSVEFMIVTMQSFNVREKDKRIIYNYRDGFPEKPIDLIRSTRPILIMDEPQKMGGQITTDKIAEFNPLFALRYSATHKDYYNLVYRLSPYEAYRKGLVKKIEVAAITTHRATGSPLIVVEKLASRKTSIKATLRVNKLLKKDDIQEKEITVELGDDLETITNLGQYEGYVVDEINIREGFISFHNGVRIMKGEGIGDNKEEIFRMQIRETIKEHFSKQYKLIDTGIKVMSLFFIDKVANFIDDEGIIRRAFIEAFNELKKGEWTKYEPEDVWGYYFSEQSKGKYKDTGGSTQKDEDTYNLIMRDKERLLSFNEPRCFIFSHSALREGWDNPNVFQICTLNTTKSDMKKRQEIGRGVRLAVDQAGNRLFDGEVNKLTVFANESYESYIETLQNEIEEEGGDTSHVKEMVKDHRERVVLKRKKLTPEFEALWNRIKQRTRYSVYIDTTRLITNVVQDLLEEGVSTPSIVMRRATVELEDDSSGLFGAPSVAKHLGSLERKEPYSDVIADLLHHLQYNKPPLHISRNTLLNIIQEVSGNLNILDNPSQFVLSTSRFIKNRVAEELINGIKYEKMEAYYEMAQVFEEEVETWGDLVLRAEKSIYDQVYIESNIEETFARKLDSFPRIKLFVKLPRKFKVGTPVGDYNPDWAIIVDDEDQPETECNRLYLIAETKGTNRIEELRTDEQHKIKCGQKHFEEFEDVTF